MFGRQEKRVDALEFVGGEAHIRTLPQEVGGRSPLCMLAAWTLPQALPSSLLHGLPNKWCSPYYF